MLSEKEKIRELLESGNYKDLGSGGIGGTVHKYSVLVPYVGVFEVWAYIGEDWPIIFDYKLTEPWEGE